jgi:nitroreductase
MAEKILKLLEAGNMAPSGDNCQPWQFIVHGNDILQKLLPDRDRSLYSWGNCPSYVAHGAVIENLVIASQTLGLRLECTLFPDSADENVIAHFCVNDDIPPRTHQLYDAIWRRCTNRKPYEAEPIPEALRREIFSCVDEFPGMTLGMTEDKEKIGAIAHAASVNECVLFENEAMHNFFYEHVLWSEREEEEKRMGFRPENLEIPRPAIPIFRFARNWKKARFLNMLGFPKALSAGNARNYAKAAAIGGVVIPDATKQSFLSAGRAFQRIWLTVTAAGWSLQPLTGIMFLAMRILNTVDSVSLSEKHQLLIKDAYNETMKNLGVSESNVLAFGFRIGKDGMPTVRTKRRQLDRGVVLMDERIAG